MNAPTTFDMIDEEKSMGNPSASDASTSLVQETNFTIHPNCRVEEVMFSYAPYEILAQLHITPAAPLSFQMADNSQPTTTDRLSPAIIDLVSDSDEEIHSNKLLPLDDDSDIEFLGVFPKPHGAVVSQTPIHRPFPRARKKHRQSAPSTTGRSRHPAAVSEVIVLSD
ncbi:hypothetical protein DL93DRAFT_2081034 [Clavulina sp. PMI_390]|nr:hypothetical protein DL93DRAFT_2081034 [Clavulina sp. PMI_390]